MYMSGRTDTAAAHGLSIARICHVLAINGVMKAKTIFRLCRTLVFHPSFPYGFRDLGGYEKYRKNIEKNRKVNAIRDELLEEAREELKRRIEQEGL